MIAMMRGLKVDADLIGPETLDPPWIGMNLLAQLLCWGKWLNLH